MYEKTFTIRLWHQSDSGHWCEMGKHDKGGFGFMVPLPEVGEFVRNSDEDEYRVIRRVFSYGPLTPLRDVVEVQLYLVPLGEEDQLPFGGRS